MKVSRRALLGAGTAALATTAGCLSGGGNEAGEIQDAELTLATTTSTHDTGLLEEVNAAFTERFGARVATLPKGTGAALRTAEDGDADVVLVHARALEDEFMRNGYGVNRRDLMFNDFVVLGPTDDPAGIAGSATATDALASIADAETLFVSRGDDSGTHAKERSLWEAATTEPSGEWYQELGSGMGETLRHAGEADAYTLADRGTYLSMRDDLSLEILVQGPIEGGPERLANPYGIMAVNPAIHSNVEYDLAMAYIGFLTSPEGQEIIEEFTVDDTQLFYPEAVAESANFQQYVPQGWTPSDDSNSS